MSTGYRGISLGGGVRKRTYLPKAVLPLLFVIGLSGLYWAGIAMSDPLLTVRNPPEPADIIVVLGGDGPARADRAAELYRAGLASRLLVSGDGDCRDIANQMTRSGVGAEAIEVECASRSTAENASFSAPLLRAAHIRKAILVTSWYHSRRAMETFESETPEIRWLSLPVEPPGSWRAIAAKEGLQLHKEYPKIVVYRLRRFFRHLRGPMAAWLGFVDIEDSPSVSP